MASNHGTSGSLSSPEHPDASPARPPKTEAKQVPSPPITPRLQLPSIRTGLPVEERPDEVLRIATEAFALTGNWVVFFRELFGTDGVVRRLFPDPDERGYFEKTPQYRQIQEMMAGLRGQDISKGDAAEPERMITLRIPISVHQSLCDESEESNLSVNKLCITKLLQAVDSRFVPLQQGRRRGRKPGPQRPRKPKGEMDQQEIDGVEMTRMSRSRSGDWTEQ